jgi:hypothetical protein
MREQIRIYREDRVVGAFGAWARDERRAEVVEAERVPLSSERTAGVSGMQFVVAYGATGWLIRARKRTPEDGSREFRSRAWSDPVK